MKIAFTLPIVPPKTTSQTKRLTVMANGRPRFFKSEASERAEHDYLLLLRPHVPSEPMVGAVQLHVAFCWPHLARTPKTKALGQLWKTTRPDADNLVKQLQDCLVTLRFVHDDGQIARLVLEKSHGPTAFVKIALTEL